MSKLIISPPIIAHRGASGHAPENTLAAFIKAVQSNAKWVEFDVMLTEDAIPIIFHDDELNRITDGQGLVNARRFSYIQTLDAGSWFHSHYASERVLTLAQGLDFLFAMGMSMNIELKSELLDTMHLQSFILPIVQPYLEKANDRFLFSSFNVETLYALRTLLPECQIGLLQHEWQTGWQQIAQDLNCVAIHASNDILNTDIIQEIHASAKSVFIYTVNQVQLAKTLFQWGVDAIFTDYPETMFQVARTSPIA